MASNAADRILLTRIGPSQAPLMLSNSDGSGEVALTKGTLDYNPSWSADGRWIVFTSERDGSADLYRMRANGSGVEQLTDDPSYDDQAAFSPDGKQIVFVSTRAAGTANLWILDLRTKAAHPLTSDSGGDFRPAWSPNGEWIAFSSDRGSSLPHAKGRWEHLQLVDIYLIRPDGSDLKRVSKHGDFCGSPKWSKDGKSLIAYCMAAQDTWTFRTYPEDGETELMKIDVATATATPMNAGPGVKLFASILPSGELGFVRRDKKAMGIFYSNGKQGPRGYVQWPAWSPDGMKVVYGRPVTMPAGQTRKLWSRNPKYELISTGALPNYDSTGHRYLSTKLDAATNSSSLQMTTDDRPPRNLLQTTGELVIAPAWSPDGNRVVFGIGKFSAFLDFAIGARKPVDPVNGGAQIGIMNCDGTGFRKITSGVNNNGFPSFSPDGKHIVYRTMGPGGDGLRIMDLENGSITPLTDGYDNFPVWSPRGNLIAFVRRVDNDFEVFTVRPDGKEVNRLTHSKGNDAHLNWSPDGDKILFATTRMGFKDEALYTMAPQPYGELFVMRFDGTEVEQITDNQWEDAGPAWQPKR